MSDRANLYWLPQPPAEFSKLARATYGTSGEALGEKLRELSGYSLNTNQLFSLAKLVARARGEGRKLAPLSPLRLGLVSNSTYDLIVPALIASALRYGIALEVIETPFDQVMQEALNPDSILAREKPDLILVAVDVHGLPLPASPGDLAAGESAVNGAVDYLKNIRDGLVRNTGATVVLQTIARLPESSFGSFEFRLAGTERWLLDRFNRALADNLADTDLLLDVSAIAETVGLDRWHDPVSRNIAKLPFAQDMVPLYADYFGRLAGALRGKSRRCLILDLDNTLWGGVIGDDGVEGIVIGQGDATGEAHLAVQRGALSLHGRGIVLAVSSKNDDAVARTPFQSHPDMLLREEHFAAFQANWTNKAANIKVIAEALSLGLESFVFLDDNPAERLQVRQVLPQVAVPELTADPALYLRSLLAGGYFEAIAFSDEDRKRVASYKSNALRLTLQARAGDMQSYLKSLDMTINFAPFDGAGRSRIAQLISKSNQFNLTTRRYSEADVGRLQNSAEHMTLQVRLADTFGDNGMISVIVCRKNAEIWEIDTWLMSCRVLGRGVEEAVLQEIIRQASAAGAGSLIGRYVPTDRNGMVSEHYRKLGFTLVETQAGDVTVWKLPLEGAAREPVPMKIQRDPVPG